MYDVLKDQYNQVHQHGYHKKSETEQEFEEFIQHLKHQHTIR